MELQLSLQSVELFAGVDNWLATPTPQKDLTVLGAWTKPSVALLTIIEVHYNL